MSVNDINSPVDLPNNDWTQMIEAIHARNQRGAPMPSDAGVPQVGTPMPSARSADLGRPVAGPHVDPHQPLTEHEVEELNQQALKSGFIVGPVNPSIARTLGATDDEPALYGSLEEAIAAGAPVGADAQAIAEGAMRFREAAPSAPAIQVRSPRTRVGPVAAAPVTFPHLPDFKKVQMIDMVNGKVYVDELAFDLEAGELKTLRKFCVTKAKDHIQKILDAALKELSEEASDAMGDAGTS